MGNALEIHLDTDIGGDMDDLCALAMLLRWSVDTHLVGVTTVTESKGKRAGYARHALDIEGRCEIPVAAGADVSQGFYRFGELSFPSEERYWPEPVSPLANSPDEAIYLLKKNIEQGVTIVGIGPYTNLHLLDLKFPGILKDANLFLMGGYIYPIRNGFPQWGINMDFNIQADVKSAKYVLENSSPTLIPLTVSVETALRRVHLSSLRKSGALGQLIAKQAEEFAVDEEMERKFRETCERLPNDIINFLHDPLACAVALGWKDGLEMREIPLIFEVINGWLHEKIDATGRPTKVVTKIDGDNFNELWAKIIFNHHLSH